MGYEETRTQIVRALPKGATGAEIGVWKGDFSARILAQARPKKLYLIDPWKVSDRPEHTAAWYGSARAPDMDEVYGDVRARFDAEIKAGTVETLRAPSSDALSALPDAALDFAYVDGDHRYEVVRQDLELCVAKVRTGGLICVDDHILGRWWGDGVVRALNETLGAHPAELEVRYAHQSQVVLVRL